MFLQNWQEKQCQHLLLAQTRDGSLFGLSRVSSNTLLICHLVFISNAPLGWFQSSWYGVSVSHCLFCSVVLGLLRTVKLAPQKHPVFISGVFRDFSRAHICLFCLSCPGNFLYAGALYLCPCRGSVPDLDIACRHFEFPKVGVYPKVG